MGDIKASALFWKRIIFLLLKQFWTSHWTDLAALSQLAVTLCSCSGVTAPHSDAAPVVLIPGIEGQSPFAAVAELPMREAVTNAYAILAELRDKKTVSSLVYNYLVGRKLKWQYLSFCALVATFRRGVTLGKGKGISQVQTSHSPVSRCKALPVGHSAPLLPCTGMPFILLVSCEFWCRQWHNWI